MKKNSDSHDPTEAKAKPEPSSGAEESCQPREDWKKKAEEKEAKAREVWDQLLRQKADFENTRKRLEREKAEAIKFANERLLAEILPAVDNLDRARLSLAEGHDPEKVKQGLEIAQQELHQVLELHGVRVVKSIGEPFDPKVHEAVGVVETDEAPEGTVVDEIQRGYTLNERLIRPSRVRVAQAKSEK